MISPLNVMVKNVDVNNANGVISYHPITLENANTHAYFSYLTYQGAALCTYQYLRVTYAQSSNLSLSDITISGTINGLLSGVSAASVNVKNVTVHSDPSCASPSISITTSGQLNMEDTVVSRCTSSVRFTPNALMGKIYITRTTLSNNVNFGLELTGTRMCE